MRRIAKFGWHVLATLAVALFLNLVGSYQVLEGRGAAASLFQDLSQKVLSAGLGFALLALLWSLRQSTMLKPTWPSSPSDVELFQAWREGSDAALGRILTPGLKLKDPQVNEFVSKLKSGARTAKRPIGSLWPLWRPTDHLDLLVKD